MKACKLTFNGNRYMVNAQGVVARFCESDLGIPGFADYHLCDHTEADAVLVEVARLRRNKASRIARRSRDQLMRDLGMVKVRGALGGTYWE